MVLALLTEVVALHIQMAILYVGISEFEKPIIIVSFRPGWCLVSSLFDIDPYKLLEEDIDRGRF